MLTASNNILLFTIVHAITDHFAVLIQPNKKYLYLKGKKLSFCQKLKFSNPYIFATLDHLFLKYQRATVMGCKDMDIKNVEFVSKVHFLCNISLYIT